MAQGSISCASNNPSRKHAMTMAIYIAMVLLLIPAVGAAHGESCTQGDCNAEANPELVQAATDNVSLFQSKLKIMSEIEQELLEVLKCRSFVPCRLTGMIILGWGQGFR